MGILREDPSKRGDRVRCLRCDKDQAGLMIEGYCLACFDRAVRSTGLPADLLANLAREGAVIS